MDRNDDGTSHARDTEQLKARFTGQYNVYRHSTIALGELLVGNLTIAWDPDTRAIVTDEEYAIPDLDRTFHLDGYLFGYDRRFRLLSRYRTSRQPQVAYIDRLEPDNNRRVRYMSGVVVDIEESGPLYVTRIVFVRIRESKEKERPRTALLEEIPRYAQIKLTQIPAILGQYIFEF